jgi:polysaccharide biosynthesis protein PelA
MSRVSARDPAQSSPPQAALAARAAIGRARLSWTLLILWLLVPVLAAGAVAQPSVAFFYGADPPLEVLRDFDWVVVQPAALARPDSLASSHTMVFGYLSLGELEKDSAAARSLPARCRLGENRLWNTWIVDQSQSACRTFYLEQVFKPLRAQGYRNFFFDTLDSYQLVLDSPAARASYRSGLIDLIQAMHRNSPDARFILNRGFELLDALAGQGVIGVAAESLYSGWDPRTHGYGPVDPAASQQLLDQLERVRKAGLTAIAIDYLPAAVGPGAERLAQRIASHGIVPYVSSAALDVVGVSSIAPLPRRVLVLYDEEAGGVLTSDVNRYAAMPLNHLGYATQGIDVTREALPAGPLTGQVAGIVTWFHSDHFSNSTQTWRWLRAQMKAGVPVAILSDLGMPVSASGLEPLGLRLGAPPPPGLNAARIAHVERDYFGFENPVLASAPDFNPIQLANGGTPLLAIEVAGATEIAAAITPWGGYALAPYVLRSLPQGDLSDGENQAAWILDPFRFFRAALHLPQAPAYDFTTASGRRLLFTLIDGDGFSSGSWIGAYRGEPAAEVILNQVLERIHLPVTASVIAAEFIEHGLNSPTQVAELRPIARRIFALPWVQIGTHTYSHPFDWPALERDPGLSAGLHIEAAPAGAEAVVHYHAAQGLKYGYNLPVPGYRFSAETEVTGSADIINRLLAPPGKRVRVIQWSGDTDPGAEVLGLAYRDGLENINGINSTITRAHPSLTNVVPLGAWQGPYFQVYSPIADEDEFTHSWQPNYCGFIQATQTMQMTDRPRRLAAMEIYYHYYSGARPCALSELLQVYRWAQAQPATPVFASTYSRIAVGFESAGLARVGGGFLARGYGLDQELRLPAALGYPDLERSRNVAGYDDFDGRRYIHLGPGDEAQLYLQAAPPRRPFLRSANGLIVELARTPETLDLRLEAQMPLALSLGNARDCRIRIDGRERVGKPDARGDVNFQLTEHRAHVELTCRG